MKSPGYLKASFAAQRSSAGLPGHPGRPRGWQGSARTACSDLIPRQTLLVAAIPWLCKVDKPLVTLGLGFPACAVPGVPSGRHGGGEAGYELL